jgi:microcystin-dependent protein
MRYYRRPLLAGKNLKRLVTASLRGNLRRNNPDAVSTVPYFPDVVAGMSLDVSTQTSTATISFTTNVFDTILSELRAGLAAAGATAFDDGGCIGISSTTTGSAGWIAVTGGTGAAALGFDYLAQEFRSRGGELGSAAEGRLGQPFGTVLPNVGESFTTESVNRALGRVMANTDALYADAARCNGYMKMVASGTASGTAPLDTLALPADQKVFVDVPLLSEGVDPRYLEPYFVVFDTYTGSRAQCRVTDVVDGGGVSLLGTDHVVTSNAPITEIKNGRVLKTEGTLFSTIAQVGDFVQISSAQNNDPWSNNGAMWVIEEVVDDVHLALRPMSHMELSNYGFSDSAYDQPVVELNTRRVGTQSLGTLTISRGPYATGAVLHFSPRMPIGMTYEIWAIVPVEANDNTLGKSLGSLPPVFSDGPGAGLPNALLSRPAVEMVGSDLYVPSFDVRINSKSYHIPETTFSSADGFVPPAYVYFDIGTMLVQWGPWPGSTEGVLPLAYVDAAYSSSMMARVDGTTGSATVGSRGQFSTLTEAFAYITQFDSAGDLGYFELILLDNQTPPVGGWVVTSSRVRIRGANLDVHVGPASDGGNIFTGSNAQIVLEGLSFHNLGSGDTYPGCLMRFVNVIDISQQFIVADAFASTILLGPSSNIVAISATGKTTEVRGALYVNSVIDAYSTSSSLYIGRTNQAAIEIGRTASPTDLYGSSIHLSGGQTRVSGSSFLVDNAAQFTSDVKVGAFTTLYYQGHADFANGLVKVTSSAALTLGTSGSSVSTILRPNGTASFLDGNVQISATDPMFQVAGLGQFNDLFIGSRVSGGSLHNGSLVIGQVGVAEGKVATIYGDGSAAFGDHVFIDGPTGVAYFNTAVQTSYLKDLDGSSTLTLQGSKSGANGAVYVLPYTGASGPVFTVMDSIATQLLQAQTPAVRVAGDTHTVGVIFAAGLLAQNSVDVINANGSPGVLRSVDSNAAYANAPKWFGCGAELYTQYGHAYLTLRDLTTGSSYTLSDTNLALLVGGSSTNADSAHSHAALCPVGTVLPFAGSTAPAGFLLCDGTAQLKASYPALYAVIGANTFQADGATTFFLPDLRGRVPIGTGVGTGQTFVRGGYGGEEQHTLIASEMPNHTHTVSAHHASGATFSAGAGGAEVPSTATLTTSSAGSGLPHNNMQPYVVLNYIIKY